MTTPKRFRDRLTTALTRPSTGAALALVVIGILFALVELQSPSRLYWTGDPVSGTNSGGIIYYQVAGENFTLDAPGAAPSHDVKVTVYVDPHDPGQGLASRPTRWVDAGLVAVWFVAAAGCLTVAALRRTSIRHRRTASGASGGPTFGDGLSPDLIARYLDQATRPPRRPPP